MPDMFTPAASDTGPLSGQAAHLRSNTPDYAISPSGTVDHIIAFAIGFALGFVVLFVFYKIIALSIFGGAAFGLVYIFISAQNAIKKRKAKLRMQFFDLLEAMSVAMRAGNPPLKALESARGDLALIYSGSCDVIIELNIIVAKFNNAVPLSVAFSDFADRSGLEDVASFASVYATIEGKSGRADEIVRETQQIIADKMEIEMEIETMMTAAKNQLNIMLVMPLVILLVMTYAGAGFMDAIYTQPMGRVVATAGLAILAASYVIGTKVSKIKL